MGDKMKTEDEVLVEEYESKLGYKYWVEGEGLPKVKEWIDKGLNNKEIYEMMNVPKITFYSWRRKYPVFENLFKVGRKIASLRMVDTLIKSAEGFYYDEEVVDNKGQVVTVRKFQQPSVQAQTFLLKNWDRGGYRDRWEVEHTGALPVILKGEEEIPD